MDNITTFNYKIYATPIGELVPQIEMAFFDKLHNSGGIYRQKNITATSYAAVSCKKGSAYQASRNTGNSGFDFSKAAVWVLIWAQHIVCQMTAFFISRLAVPIFTL